MAETKNSWDNITYESWFKRENKETENKPRYDLIPRDVLKRIAELYTRGAKIYGDDNWSKARWEELNTFKQSAFRHFIQWMEGETDEEHGIAVIWNVMWREHCVNKEGHLPPANKTTDDMDNWET